MPTYTYVCDICGAKQDMFLPVSHRDSNPPCREEHCDGACTRDVVASMSGQDSANREYDTPVVSYSMGVPLRQVDEARARFPHHEYRDDGALIIRSHAERQRVLKDIGMLDLRDS